MSKGAVTTAIGGVGLICGVVVVVMLLTRPSGVLTVEPSAYRCDDLRTHTLTLGYELNQDDWITVEVYRGNRMVSGMTQKVSRIFGPPIEMGVYQVRSSTPAAIDCDGGPGAYRFVVREGEAGALLSEVDYAILR